MNPLKKIQVKETGLFGKKSVRLNPSDFNQIQEYITKLEVDIKRSQSSLVDMQSKVKISQDSLVNIQSKMEGTQKDITELQSRNKELSSEYNTLSYEKDLLLDRLATHRIIDWDKPIYIVTEDFGLESKPIDTIGDLKDAITSVLQTEYSMDGLEYDPSVSDDDFNQEIDYISNADEHQLKEFFHRRSDIHLSLEPFDNLEKPDFFIKNNPIFIKPEELFENKFQKVINKEIHETMRENVQLKAELNRANNKVSELDKLLKEARTVISNVQGHLSKANVKNSVKVENVLDGKEMKNEPELEME